MKENKVGVVIEPGVGFALLLGTLFGIALNLFSIAKSLALLAGR